MDTTIQCRTDQARGHSGVETPSKEEHPISCQPGREEADGAEVPANPVMARTVGSSPGVEGRIRRRHRTVPRVQTGFRKGWIHVDVSNAVVDAHGTDMDEEDVHAGEKHDDIGMGR